MHVLPLLHSWKSQRGKKRGRGPKSEDDDGFEVVPIEDPGESAALSGREGRRRCGYWGGAVTSASLPSEASDPGP